MEATLTVTEAARNLVDVVNRAHYGHEATTLIENGQPVARVVPAAGVARTGKEIAARMATRPRPRLADGDAEAFAADLREVRAELPEPLSPWD
ncbi:MAG TPA: type II toxin-antitoxin system prevent-host-death family antitoxin [Chthoniobacteraceae bacterium]|jgi:prevent-host-death family protein|nr:type II toxin-antitoxin system prevent-host-death family antitoxin [Chthoniobacteraceae bacterium]